MDNQRFTELLTKESAGDLSKEEQEELRSLLQRDAGYRKEYELLKTYWAKKDISYTDVHSAFEKVKDKIRAAEEAVGVGEEVGGSEIAGPFARGYRRLLTWQKYAAVFILALGGYGIYRLVIHTGAVGTEQTGWQEKYAARGSKSRLTLSDGSHITLNADSRLKYPVSFEGNTREVYLSGEAFFDVQKDPDHPFIIHTARMNIRVLGTAFNVRSYPDDPSMETTLLRGSIEVTFPDRPSDRIILKPKDKLIIGNGAGKTEPSLMSSSGLPDKKIVPVATNPDTHYSLTGLTYFRAKDSTIVETSWIDDKLAFSNEDFQSLARRMERWYGLTIDLDNKKVASYRFTGLFRKESIMEALYALQLTEKFRYTLTGSTIHIY